MSSERRAERNPTKRWVLTGPSAVGSARIGPYARCMNRRRLAAAVIALGIAGATPVGASATGSLPADKQYGNPISQTPSSGGVSGQGNQAGTVPAQGNNLPFTGFDAGLAVAGGLTLVGLGLGLRRFSRRSGQ